MNKYFSELKTKIGLLPTDLKMLFWFSVICFFPCVSFLIFAREQLYEQIIPYTGWSPGIIYFCFISILVSLKKTKNNENYLVDIHNARYKIIFLLGIYSILGIFDWFTTEPELYTHTNPYLRYEPLRPIFAIFLPVLWIFVISWPIVKNSISKDQKFLF